MAQLLPAGLSGAFQIAMLLTPYIALSTVVSDETKETNEAAITWGRFMGGLEPFVRLYVPIQVGGVCIGRRGTFIR